MSVITKGDKPPIYPIYIDEEDKLRLSIDKVKLHLLNDKGILRLSNFLTSLEGLAATSSAGAVVGATIGSLVPGVGTIVGGILGASLGSTAFLVRRMVKHVRED